MTDGITVSAEYRPVDMFAMLSRLRLRSVQPRGALVCHCSMGRRVAGGRPGSFRGRPPFLLRHDSSLVSEAVLFGCRL